MSNKILEELVTGEYGDICIDHKIEPSGTLYMGINGECDYIDKAQALEIIEHLQQAFELEVKK